MTRFKIEVVNKQNLLVMSRFKTLILNKENIMRSLLYIIAVELVIEWIVGFVGYSAGGLIHILLVIAIIAILFDLIRGLRPV